MPVDDRPGQLVGGQVGLQPGGLGRAGPLGVERDEVDVAPVVRIPALDAVGAAVFGQHEHLTERRGVGGLVFVVAAGREHRPRRQQRRVDAEELALEVAERAAVVGDVAGVDHEVERDGLDLLEQRPLVAAAAARVAQREELDAARPRPPAARCAAARAPSRGAPSW